MKKFVLSCILSTVVLGGMSFVAEAQTVIPVKEKSSIETNCTPSETTNYSWYLDDDGSYTNPADDFWVSGFDALILNGNNGSSIDIWRNGDVLTKCNTWRRMSNIVKNGDKVVAFQNNDKCVFNIPSYVKTGYDTIDAQIHFTIGYRKVRNGGPETFPSDQIFFYKYRNENNYHCYPNGNSVSDANTCTKTNVRYGSNLTHVGECQNYRLFRCGDGLVSNSSIKYSDGSTHIEECDPEAPEWKNRTDGKKCSASCTIQQAPICNSQYNGKRVYTSTSSAYLNGSEGLCISGSVMGFNQDWTVKNPRSFTWGCTSSVGSTANDACSLKQYRCGDGIVSAEGTNWNYSNGAHYESCDPEAPEWKNRTDGKKCNSSCNIEYVPSSCGRLNGNKAYNTGYSSPRITENSAGLCGTGKLVAGSLSYNKNTGKYTWSCQNGTSPAVACNAEDLWCGDGQVTNGEQCDPNDPDRTGWKDGSWKSCNSSCKLEDIPRVGPVCSSVYNGTTQYTSTSNPWISTSDTLCSKGNLVQGSFNYSGSPRTFTWSCTNDGITTGCIAYQQWCGDGKKNGTEVCDPKDSSHSGWGDGCSETCQPTYDAGVCGSKYNGKKTYLDISKDWITKNTQGLCDVGVVTGFYKHPSSKVYTWQCENHGKVSEQCRADQEWCGDGKYQSNEEKCDYNDPAETNWGNDGCDHLCQPITQPISGCDQVFYHTLRQGEDYTFWDVFNAEDADRRLYGDPVVKFVEQKDYNRGPNPTFRWTNWNSEKMVPENTSVKVVESTPKYHIYDHPDVRGNDNLYIEYELQYANRENAPESRRKTHKECVYYQISRCGDGVLDTEEGEKCDPGSSEWKNRPDGKECNSSCEIVDNPKGEPKIEKTLVGKKTVENTGEILTWEVRVIASGGSVSGFTVEDIVPEALKYKDSKVISNTDNLTVSQGKKVRTTSTGEVYAWEVTGELKEGNRHELVIEVTTEVVKMPKSEDDYRNVACVIKDNKKDCDDDKPSPIVGEPKIEKTLVGKKTVEKTGEILTWEVRVIASGGSVSGFTVEDIVPAALKYKSSKVTSNRDNLKVSEATKTKTTTTGEVYTWEVTGELKEGHELIIEVTTEVVKMPKSEDDYRNVACVIKDNKKDCDDDKPNPVVGEPKIEKTLVGKKTVEKTGEILTWEVRVVASGGSVSGFTVEDIVPAALKYKSSKVTSNRDNLKVSEATKTKTTTTGEVYTWEVTGELKEGHELIIEVTTEVVKMPKSEDDYRNVACVIKDNKKDCDDDKPSPTAGELDVEKTLISEDKYVSHVGQGLEWKVTVKAKYGDVQLEKIRDIFPAEYLSFTGYEQLGNWKEEGITITHFEADNKKGEAIWNVTGTLKSGHKIELKVYTIVHTMPEGTVKNVACVKPVDPGKEDCGTGYTSDLRIKKFVWDKNKWAKSTTGNSGDTITYKIEFGNYGDTGVYVTLKDFLPKDIQVTASSLSLNYANHDTEFGSDNENPYRGKWEKVDNVYINIYSGVYLRPNSEGVMMITGTALHSDSSNHNRTNFACIYENGKKIACDDAIYNVEEEKNVKCISLKNGSNVTLGCDEEPEDRPTEVTCRSSKPAKIEIVCKDFNGNEEIVEEADGVTELTGSCSFSTIKHNSVQCKIDGKVDEKCVAEYNMSTKDCPIPTQPICTDIKVKGKTVTCYADEDAYFRIQGCYGLEPGENNTKKMGEDREPDHTFKCPDGVSPKAYCQVSKTGKDGEWDTSDDCKNPDSDIPKEFQTCFNVNAGNFSIEEGEIFPFYWNLINLENISTEEDIYVEVNDGDYDNAISTYTAGSEDSCDDGQIAIDSMVCTFEIYDGGKYNALNSNAEPLYTIKGPCLSEGEAYTNSKLIQAWYDEMVETHCGSESKSVYCSMSFNLNREGKGLLNSSVYYIQKFGDGAGVYLNGKPRDKAEWTDWKKDESKKSLGEYKIRLANVEYLQCNGGSWEQKNGGDSVVCEHDFMVTSPYTIQKTPSGNLKASTDELSRYRSIEGKYTFTGYVEKIDTTAYNANTDVKKAMDEFISKYAKLAVDVKTKGKFEIPSGTTIKKVPGKNIYFVDGKITIKGGKNIDTPFTLVQTSGSTIIEGNVGHNMMLLTRGNIKFSGDCTSDQTVKGIYYAENKLLRNKVGKNKDLDVRVWCTNGGLHVKGVLIGGGFDDLMKDSRSNLNKWFDGTTSRKTTLMNGGSVVIEYSPSIFTKSTMPPGAEDFTTALSIYRQ